MKVGIIPCAGEAKRLAPYPSPKELFPIGFQWFPNNLPRTAEIEKRPKVIAQYLIEKMVKGGAERIYLIINDDKMDILKYFGDGHRFGTEIIYLCQEEPKGMPQALDLVTPFLSQNDIVYFGMADTIFEPVTAYDILGEYIEESGADVVLGCFEAGEKWYKLGMVRMEGLEETAVAGEYANVTGKIIEIVDKPKKKPDTDWAWGIACWRGSYSGFIRDYIKQYEGRYTEHRREIPLGHTFSMAIDKGLSVKALCYEGAPYFDIGTGEELRQAQRYFLENSLT